MPHSYDQKNISSILTPFTPCYSQKSVIKSLDLFFNNLSMDINANLLRFFSAIKIHFLGYSIKRAINTPAQGKHVEHKEDFKK